jgi:hypothetical protein
VADSLIDTSDEGVGNQQIINGDDLLILLDDVAGDFRTGGVVGRAGLTDSRELSRFRVIQLRSLISTRKDVPNPYCYMLPCRLDYIFTSVSLEILSSLLQSDRTVFH